MNIFNIFGPKVEEPKNFDEVKFTAILTKFRGYMEDKVIICKDYGSLAVCSLKDTLLPPFRPLPAGKVIKKFLETGDVLDRKTGKRVVLDAEFMQEVVKPIMYARLNCRNNPLAEKILLIAFEVKYPVKKTQAEKCAVSNNQKQY